MDHQARMQRTLGQRIIHVLVPLLAHRHHRRYEGLRHLLVIDTLLGLAMLALLGWNLALLTGYAPFGPHASLRLSGPASVARGDSVTFTISMTNGDEPLTDALVIFVAPDGFRRTDAPQPDEKDENRWALRDVPAGETVERTVTGRLFDAPDGNAVFEAALVAVTDRGAIARRSKSRIVLTSSHVSIAASGPAAATSGTPVAFSATVTNDSDEPLHNLVVNVEVPAAFSRTTSAPAGDARGWHIGDLGPRTSATVKVNGTFTTEQEMKATIVFRVGFLAGDTTFEQGTSRLAVTVAPAPTAAAVVTAPASASTFSTEARYRSSAGTTVGFGPVPLRAGATTGFRIFIVAQHAGTSPARAVFSATLPANADWLGNATATAGGAVTYDAATRRISWTIDAVQPGTLFSAGFDVSVTPQSTDAGKAASLLSASTMAFAGTPAVTLTAPAITTAMTDLGSDGLVAR